MPLIPSTVAVLDDEPKMRKALYRLLSTHGFVVNGYASASDLLAGLAAHPADCLVLDLHMPETSGFEVLETFAARKITVPVIVITAHDGPGTAERTRELGACAFLTKPVAESALVRAIETAIRSPES